MTDISTSCKICGHTTFFSRSRYGAWENCICNECYERIGKAYAESRGLTKEAKQ